jgi:energy-coupling factor transporter ATP-binding protein EcfA2
MEATIEVSGLQKAARRKAGGYSLGMRQRLGIAAALLGDPPVLMFDEPFNGMDPEGIVWMRGFLTALAGEGRAVLVSSHLMAELQDTADHLVVAGHGKVIADTTVAGLLYIVPVLTDLGTLDPTWEHRLQEWGPMTARLAIQATRNLKTLPIGPWPGMGVLAAWAAAALLADGRCSASATRDLRGAPAAHYAATGKQNPPSKRKETLCT